MAVLLFRGCAKTLRSMGKCKKKDPNIFGKMDNHKNARREIATVELVTIRHQMNWFV